MGLTESSFNQSLIKSECFSQIRCSSTCNNCNELDVEMIIVQLYLHQGLL